MACCASAAALSMHFSLRLLTGSQIPIIGFGTYKVTGAQVDPVVNAALDAGYRHFDTARFYENEKELGAALNAAIASGKVKREDLFVTTKLWYSDQGYDSATRAFETSLQKLGLDYVDLYLIHWPGSSHPAHSPLNAKLRTESWRALEKIYAAGKARAIGVSNYTVRHLQELLVAASVTPAVNQVEFHPLLYQKDLFDFCNQHGIVLTAYSSIGKGKLVDNLDIGKVAAKYGKFTAQILLRWAMQHGVIVIPKSSSPDRLRQNANVFDFEISQDDMTFLDGLNQNWHCAWDPSSVV